jgi:hypothetical protein
MAETPVRTPSGEIIRVRHPEGATDEQIIAYAKANAPIYSAEANNTDILSRQPTAPPSPTWKDTAIGTGEAALAIGTAIPVETVRGALSGTEMLAQMLRGRSDPNATREKWESMADSYTPRTAEGQRVLGMATAPFRMFDEATSSVAGKVADLPTARLYPRASGALAAAIKTAPDIGMTLAGLRGMRNPIQRRADIRGVEQRASNLGIDIGGTTREQGEGLASYAEGLDIKSMPQEDMDRLPAALARARKLESRRIGAKFDEAEAIGAQVPSRTAASLSDNLKNSVSGFAVDAMPSVQKLLKEAESFGLPAQQSIAEVLGVRNAAKIPVNSIFEFREKINQNLPSDLKSPEYAALSRMKRDVDQYLNDTLTNDLVSGNPEAITKWQAAIKDWADFRTTFDSNRVVSKLQEEGATAEQVQALIFGLGKTKAPRQAAQVIGTLEKILGRDSPEFKSIQAGLMTKLVDPLIAGEPDLAKFSKDYDAFVKNNKTLVDTIFNPDQRQALDEMDTFAKAIKKTSSLGEEQMKTISLVWQNIAARFWVGHAIAQGAAKVSLVTKALEAITPKTGASRKNAVMAEILGYDPSKSIFQNTNPTKTVGTYEALSAPQDPRELAKYLRIGR